MIEANPRASRTVPFVSKAVGLPLAKLACRVMLGESIAALNLPREREGLGFGDHVSVKEAVLPFDRFEGSDAVLGPEMRSTGEVMGIARDFPTAFAKAQAAAGCPLPLHGTVFISVTDADKAGAFAIAERLHENGFRILATRGTAEAIARMGIPAQALNKVSEGSPHVLDWIERGDVDLVVNTPTGSGARTDGWQIRRAAVTRGVPCLTTLAAGVSAARAISSARQSGAPPVLCLQELHRGRETWRGRRSLGAARRGAGACRAPDHAVPARCPPGPGWRDRRRSAARRPPSAGACCASPATSSWAPTACCASPTRRARVGWRVARGWAGTDSRPVRDARRRGALGGRGGRAPPPAPRLLLRAHGAEGEAHFLLEDVGPGTHRLCELRRRARACGCSGRSGSASPPRPPPAAARSSSAAAPGSRRWRSGRTHCARAIRRGASAGIRPPCCSAFATAPTHEGARAAARRAARDRRRLASGTAGSSPSCSPLSCDA